jgi:hypothetical protein
MARGSYNGISKKGTSTGRGRNATKMSSMNKHKRKSFKKYRGQG